MQSTVTISMLAPAKCGKSSYIAAIHELFSQRACEVGGRRFQLDGLHGGHRSDYANSVAMEALEQGRRWLGCRQAGLSSYGWFNYRGSIHDLASGAKRDLWLLDSVGDALWPPGPVEPASNSTRHRSGPTLLERYHALGLETAEHVLVVFLNGRAPGAGEWEGGAAAISDEVACYIRGATFARVVFLVACADLVLPGAGNLEATLQRYNGWASSRQALRCHAGHFEEGGQYTFVRRFVAILRRETTVAKTEFALFWASAAGRAGPSFTLGRWTPIQVMAPLLWAAGLTEARRT